MSRITGEVLSALRQVLGEVPRTAQIEQYSHDFTEDLSFLPEAVVLPRTTEQVAAVLKIASSAGIVVTPRGGGTGLSGGALPVRGGIVLSLERMNRIIEIDTENLMAVVEPGVITEVLQNAVAEKGLFYPPDPSSRGSCLIGGNMAHGAGGPRAVKYGVTKDYIYGVEAVLFNGQVIRHGGKLLKNSTGFNLTQLLIGSEGTLAVATKLILKLVPMPSHRCLVMAPFATLEEPARAVSALFQAGITPSACEYMEQAAYAAGCRQTSEPNHFTSAAAMLLLEVDGFAQTEIDRQLELVGEVLARFGCQAPVLAETPERQNQLWRIRRSIGEAVKTRSIYKEEDTVVPRAALPTLLTEVKRLCAKHGVSSVCYGHAGDGNLHVNLLKAGLSEEAWKRQTPKLITEIFEATHNLGGTISGEHGVGWVQKDYLPLVYSRETIALMHRIKAAFDPKGILNPSKMLPEILPD